MASLFLTHCIRSFFIEPVVIFSSRSVCEAMSSAPFDFHFSMKPFSLSSQPAPSSTYGHSKPRC